MSNLLIKLNRMKKPELISLARRLNDDVKIVNVHKLKKQDLMTELLFRQDLVLKLLEGEFITGQKSKRKNKRTKKPETGNSEDENNKLLAEAVALQKKALDPKTKDSEKAQQRDHMQWIASCFHNHLGNGTD